MTGGDGATKLRRSTARRRLPGVGWAAGLFGLLLAAWSVTAPLLRSPDEPAHLALLDHVVDERAYPDYDEFHPADGIIALSIEHQPDVDDTGLRPPDRGRWLTPENAEPRSDRPSFDDLGGDAPWPYPNQLAQHPPGYYVAMAPVTASTMGLFADAPGERAVLTMRWANALLVVALPLLAASAARRLGADDATALTAALVPLAIPQVAHIGSSINNDNLLILLAAVLGVLLAGVVREDLRARTATVVGLVVAAGLWTKAPSFSFLPWVALAYVVPAVRDRRWRDRLRSCSLALGVAVVAGSPWWIRNLVRHGELSPSILDGPGGGVGGDLGPLGWPGLYVGRIAQRFWGSVGGYTATIGRPMVVLLTAALAVVVLAAFWPARARGRHARTEATGPIAVGRLRLAVFSAQVPLLVILVTASSYRHYRLTGDAVMMQGRYLFGALVPLAVVVGIGATRLLGRVAPLAVLVVAVIAHAALGHAVLRTLWAEPDASLGRSFEAMVAWSPLPGALTVGVVSAAVVGFVGLAIRLRPGPDRAPAA